MGVDAVLLGVAVGHRHGCGDVGVGAGGGVGRGVGGGVLAGMGVGPARGGAAPWAWRVGRREWRYANEPSQETVDMILIIAIR